MKKSSIPSYAALILQLKIPSEHYSKTQDVAAEDFANIVEESASGKESPVSELLSPYEDISAQSLSEAKMKGLDDEVINGPIDDSGAVSDSGKVWKPEVGMTFDSFDEAEFKINEWATKIGIQILKSHSKKGSENLRKCYFLALQVH